jgi:hypothetical protein
MFSKRAFLLLSFSLLVSLPPAAWWLVRPVRVFFPSWAGMSCRGAVCTDDPARFEEAAALYEEALTFVASSVGAVRRKPRVVFCGSEACFSSFGLAKPAGHTFGTFGIVIAPRGWKPYYVRHEMIHHLQAERLGNLQLWRGPDWFFEGMAYSLSEDPRRPLSETFEGYRSRFEEWYRSTGQDRLWVAAAAEKMR